MSHILPGVLRTLTRALLPLLPLGLLHAQLDDRENETPTGWVWYAGQSMAQVNGLVNAGFRLIDVDVQSASPLTMDVVAVQNVGSHNKAWAWYVDQTWSQVTALLAANNARPIDVDGYETSAGRRYAVIMVNNGGANYVQSWPFAASTASSVNALVASTGGRLIDLDSYVDNGARRYEGIVLANTGALARNWSYYYGVSSAFVGQQLAAGWRTYDLQRIGSDQYDVVFTNGGPPARSWTVIGVTDQQLADTQGQNGARIVAFERYVSSVIPLRWANNAILVNNSNALTTRMGDLLRNGSDGFVGVYLRELGGNVLANLNENRRFEPASTIKTLFHVHALRQVAVRAIQLQAQIPNQFIQGNPCWVQNGNGTDTLEAVLALMMQQSDNRSTIAIQDRFGNPAIQATATALGMSATQVLRDKCPGPLNTSTLVDFGLLHERVANGWLATPFGNTTGDFRRLMLSSVWDYANTNGITLGAVINQEANALGLSSQVRNEFLAEVLIAHKGGFYDRSTLFNASQFAWLRLPFRNGPVIQPREFVTGVFVDDGTNRTASGDTTNLVAREVLRDLVRSALQTWTGYTPGQIAVLGSGCTGTSGTPTIGVVGRPNAGETIEYRLTSIPALTPVLAQVGLTSAHWNGLPLPFDLAPLGAPTCSIWNDVTLSLPLSSGLQGSTSLVVALPPDPNLITAFYYLQFWVVDPQANRLGMTVSRSIRTTLGGYR